MTWLSLWLYAAGAVLSATFSTEIEADRPVRAFLVIVAWPVAVTLAVITGTLKHIGTR